MGRGAARAPTLTPHPAPQIEMYYATTIDEMPVAVGDLL